MISCQKKEIYLFIDLQNKFGFYLPAQTDLMDHPLKRPQRVEQILAKEMRVNPL